jgi:hypothetical protein
MQTVTLNTYSFTELTEAVQTKIIEKNRYINVQYNDWYEGTTEDFISTSDEKGFNATKTYFSGFSSQGDGAMFEYDSIEDSLLHEFIDSLENVSAMRKKWLRSKVVVSGKGRHQGHYYHENCCYNNIYFEFSEGYDSAPNLADWINSFEEQFETFVIAKYKTIARQLYQDLEREHDHLTTDELVKEQLIANENAYAEDGKNVNFLV